MNPFNSSVNMGSVEMRPFGRVQYHPSYPQGPISNNSGNNSPRIVGYPPQPNNVQRRTTCFPFVHRDHLQEFVVSAEAALLERGIVFTRTIQEVVDHDFVHVEFQMTIGGQQFNTIKGLKHDISDIQYRSIQPLPAFQQPYFYEIVLTFSPGNLAVPRTSTGLPGVIVKDPQRNLYVLASDRVVSDQHSGTTIEVTAISQTKHTMTVVCLRKYNSKTPSPGISKPELRNQSFPSLFTSSLSKYSEWASSKRNISEDRDQLLTGFRQIPRFQLYPNYRLLLGLYQLRALKDLSKGLRNNEYFKFLGQIKNTVYSFPNLSSLSLPRRQAELMTNVEYTSDDWLGIANPVKSVGILNFLDPHVLSYTCGTPALHGDLFRRSSFLIAVDSGNVSYSDRMTTPQSLTFPLTDDVIVSESVEIFRGPPSDCYNRLPEPHVVTILSVVAEEVVKLQRTTLEETTIYDFSDIDQVRRVFYRLFTFFYSSIKHGVQVLVITPDLWKYFNYPKHSMFALLYVLCTWFSPFFSEIRLACSDEDYFLFVCILTMFDVIMLPSSFSYTCDPRNLESFFVPCAHGRYCPMASSATHCFLSRH
ncbi:hypothetical protein GEMRC1_013113 [Eukaryota sp. GEM-RC1]